MFLNRQWIKSKLWFRPIIGNSIQLGQIYETQEKVTKKNSPFQKDKERMAVKYMQSIIHNLKTAIPFQMKRLIKPGETLCLFFRLILALGIKQNKTKKCKKENKTTRAHTQRRQQVFVFLAICILL